MRSKRSMLNSIAELQRQEAETIQEAEVNKTLANNTDDVIESCYIRQNVSPTRPMPPLNFVSPATETTKKRPGSRSPYVSVKSPFK